MSKVAIVPAAGLGTRLRPLSEAIPKEMLPVGRHLALEWIVAELEAAGIERIVFVLSPAKEPQIRAHFGQSERFAYAIQPEMRGLGDAIRCARPLVEGEESLLIALGDALFEEPTPGGLTRRLVAAPAPLAIAVQQLPLERLSRYGVVAPCGPTDGPTFPIQDIVEKPAPEQAPSRFAVTARYLVPAAIFSALDRATPHPSGELYLTEALHLLLQEGCPGQAVPLRADETRHDIGSFDTYFRAFLAFALNDPEQGAALRAHLKELVA